MSTDVLFWSSVPPRTRNVMHCVIAALLLWSHSREAKDNSNQPEEVGATRPPRFEILRQNGYDLISTQLRRLTNIGNRSFNFGPKHTYVEHVPLLNQSVEIPLVFSG